MRNPPNYGSIVNLGKNRRRPLGVRVPNGHKLRDDFTEVIQYKYIGYFENTPQGKRDARLLLAQYNAGTIEEQVTKVPTFKECADAFIKRHLETLKHKQGGYSYELEQGLYGVLNNYCKDIHECKITILKFYDIQSIADKVKNQSLSQVSRLKTVIFGAFDYARKQNYIKENFVNDVEFLYKKPSKDKHKVFTEEEVNLLWEHSEDKGVQTILMLIYTGVRINELLTLPKSKLFLDEQYFICGTKTEAGRDRIVPIADKVLPFFKAFADSDSEYLFQPIRRNNSNNLHRESYMRVYWRVVMENLGMEHIPHDTRYTCATMLDKANVKDNIIKFILGHRQSDVTNQVYVHPDVETLLENINKI